MSTAKAPAAERSKSTRKPSAGKARAGKSGSAGAGILNTDEEALHADAAEKRPEATAVSAPAEAEPVTVEEIPIVPQPELRKKELIDLAVERSGIKKRDAKPAIEAALAILGEALSEGRELNLAPFGKMKVTRMKKAGNGQIINARLRQPDEDKINGQDPLAQAAE